MCNYNAAGYKTQDCWRCNCEKSANNGNHDPGKPKEENFGGKIILVVRCKNCDEYLV